MLIDKKWRAGGTGEAVNPARVRPKESLRAHSGPVMVYVALLLTMALSFSGLPGSRWSIYVLPAVALMIWLAMGPRKLHAPREIWPFLFLVTLSLLTLYSSSFDGWKRFYFLFEYTFLFVLFEFYKTELDVRKLIAFFVLLFALTTIRSLGVATTFAELEISIADSYSSLESTFAFCFGLIALHCAIKKRYFWTVVCIGLSVLGLKRIVLVALVSVLILNFLPATARKILLHPVVLTAGMLLALVAMMFFAQGGADELVIEQTGKHPNAFAMGRQALWADALRIAEYDWQSFFLYGLGHSGITDAMANYYGAARIRLHNDVLTILLDHGWIATTLFLFFLVNLKLEDQRLMAVFIGLIFLTDNVMIYQHVMLLYLILQQQLSSSVSEAPRNIRKSFQLSPATRSEPLC